MTLINYFSVQPFSTSIFGLRDYCLVNKLASDLFQENLDAKGSQINVHFNLVT